MAAINKINKSQKHAIIDKANSTVVIAVSLAVFIVIFSLFATRTLFSQSLFQKRVIDEKKVALEVLKDNKQAVIELTEDYETFQGEAINVLGGDPKGTGPKDGDNATIVLDSLPSEFDYPGLSSSLEKVLVDGGYQISAIGGSERDTGAPLDGDIDEDDGTVIVSDNTIIEPVEIPFPFTVEAAPDQVYNLLKLLESSIRPFHIETLKIESQGASLSARIGLKTYYQPATGLRVTSKEVR